MSINADSNSINDKVIAALRGVFDPEIPVNIYELGLIYGIEVSPENVVAVRMTLTSPNCPVAEKLPVEVANKVKAIPGVKDANVQIVFDPPWTRAMMSEAAQLELDMMGIASPGHLHKDQFTKISIGRKPKRD